jgi:hypothetical protein
MCGAPNEDDADFCVNCGAAMKAEETSSTEDVSFLEDAPEETAAEAPQEIVAAEAIVGGEPVEEDVEEDLVVEAAPAAAPLVSPPTSNLAVASLVSGIAGLVLLPIVGGILAIILGYMARREIRERPDEVSGDGLALAGIVLGWISVGLMVVACLFFGAFAVCGMFGALTAGGY